MTTGQRVTMTTTRDNTSPSPRAPAPAPHHADLHRVDDLRDRWPIMWWLTLLGPPGFTLLALGLMGLVRGWEEVIKTVAAGIISFFGMGRFVILFGSGGEGLGGAEDAAIRAKFDFLTTGELFLMVTWMDMCWAVLLVCHMSFLFRIPRIGPALLRLREEGEFFMAYQPWVRRFTFVGLSLFVSFPVAATGAVAGSIFGRLLGMSRRAVLLAVFTGAVLGNGIMYFVGRAVTQWLPIFDPSNPWNLVAGVGVIVGLLLILNWRYQSFKRNFMSSRSAAVAGSPSEKAAGPVHTDTHIKT
jgi:uncharacterized membrane protein